MEEEEQPTPSLLQHAHTTIFLLPIGGGASHNFSIHNEWEPLEVGRGVGEMEEHVEVGM